MIVIIIPWRYTTSLRDYMVICLYNCNQYLSQLYIFICTFYMYLLYVHEFLKNILRYPTNFFVFFLIRIPSLVTSLDNKFSAIPFLACVIKREIMITRKEKFLRLVPFFEFSQCVAGNEKSER